MQAQFSAGRFKMNGKDKNVVEQIVDGVNIFLMDAPVARTECHWEKNPAAKENTTPTNPVKNTAANSRASSVKAARG
jgi:hypothetical protein